MINQAVTQWSDNPVITTLETISAPINDIQFPTVTVCDQKPADNWGPIEKVFNSLAFECSKLTPNCIESTKEIRKDYKLLIASFVDAYLRLLNETDYQSLIEISMFQTEIQKYKDFGVIHIVAEVLKQGKYEELIELAIQKFGTGYVYWKSIIDEIKDLFEADYNTDTSDTDLQESAVRILLLLRWTREEIPFGSFITQFIPYPLKTFKSFGSCRQNLCGVYDEMTIDCTYEIGENQRKLHEYFTELSKLFGFNETELLSLYDLPGMLADGLDYAIPAKANDKTEDDNLLGDIPQAYLYSTCKEREHVQEYFNYKDNFKQCNWQEDKLNETGIYSF